MCLSGKRLRFGIYIDHTFGDNVLVQCLLYQREGLAKSRVT